MSSTRTRSWRSGAGTAIAAAIAGLPAAVATRVAPSSWRLWLAVTSGMLALAAVAGPFHPASGAIVAGGALALLALLTAVVGLSHAWREREAERLLSIGQRVHGRMEGLRDLEWQLRESETRLRDLVDQLDALVIRRDRTGRLTFANRAFCRMFARELDDLLGTRFQPLVIDSEPVPVAPIRGCRSVSLVETAAGRRWIAFEEYPVPTCDKAECEIQIVGRDVTEEREQARALAAARDEAQAANRAKSRFLAAMSHEIRTPMNGIIGMAGLLLDTAQTAEQRSYTTAVDQSARTLLALVDEILDFSKIEAGRLVLEKNAFALSDTVQAAVELLAPRAHAKALEFAWLLDPAVPLQVVGDQARVRQILLNLIGNAIKFTDRGGVLVSVTAVSAGVAVDASDVPPPSMVAVEVRDTGIGLTPQAITRLFAEFEQAGEDLADRRGGSGLGLAISMRLARAMGGSIVVASEPGRGATFTVRLPLPPVAVMSTAVHQPPKAARALLVLDRLIERRAIAQQLRLYQVDVEESDLLSAPAAIAAAAAKGAVFDLVVFDGEDDAEEAGRCFAIARSVASGAFVRGIVLIDPATRGIQRQFATQGIDTHLVRPVRPASLLAATSTAPDRFTCTSEPGHGEASSAAHATVVERGDHGGAAADTALRVLLVEDNPINARVARHILEQYGCAVVEVADGRSAVDLVRAQQDGSRPPFDLVLMDVHLPGIDGLEATRIIRGLPRQPAKPLPIVALTANAFREDRQRCLDAGMDDYLSKPFERRDIVQILERWARPGPTRATECTQMATRR